MGAKLPPRWRYDGQLGAQDGQLVAQDGQLGSILGAVLAHRRHLGPNFIENVQIAKTIVKHKVFQCFWRPCWAMLVYLGDKMGYVGPSWRYVATSWLHLDTMLRHLGDKIRPKSAKMSSRWAPKSTKKTSWQQDGVQDVILKPLCSKTTTFINL